MVFSKKPGYDELRRRYPADTYVADMRTLKQDGPDVPWALLANNAKRVYGKPLVPCLEEVGILQKAGTVIQQSASIIRESIIVVNRWYKGSRADGIQTRFLSSRFPSDSLDKPSYLH